MHENYKADGGSKAWYMGSRRAADAMNGMKADNWVLMIGETTATWNERVKLQVM